MPAARPHTRWPLSVGLGVAGAVIVTLVVLAFLWPTKTATAHDVPIGVSGPAAAVSAFEQALDDNANGVFEFVDASDRAAAVSQIERRETYGAIVLAAPPATPEVLTAPAGSPVVAQLLSGVAARLQAQLAQQVAAAGGNPSAVSVAATPVVPLSADDPAGTGLTAAAFPLTMGGMIGGILISLLVVGVFRRLLALAGFAVAAGLLLTLVLDSWFGYLQGDFWITALATGMSVLATSAFIVGCTALIGSPGIAVGAVLTMLVGNPLSAAAVPWQFIAAPWGAIGQFFVPGAANTLLRTLSYFPAADPSGQWWILLGWTLLGVVLAVGGHFRSAAAMHVPNATLDEPAQTHATP